MTHMTLVKYDTYNDTLVTYDNMISFNDTLVSYFDFNSY